MNEIIVNVPESPMFDTSMGDDQAISNSLVGFIVPRVTQWREHREQNYDAKWEEYYRLWRGVWDPKDRVRNAERSRIIAPALQQAIEVQVSEFEEATFGRNQWFLVLDDIMDPEKEDVSAMSKLLMEDFERDKIQSAISECYLNASLYGTGIGKIVITQDPIVRSYKDENDEMQTQEDVRLSVKLVPVDPFEFVIDPAAKHVNDAMGVAHEMLVSRHSVLRKQKDGMYRDVPLGTWTKEEHTFLRSGEHNSNEFDGKVKITEYYGLVPKIFLDGMGEEENSNEEDELVKALLPQQDSESLRTTIDNFTLVEAWVTIANDATVLRAQENPFLLKDRPFVTYQHDTVPNRFWGRGVAEKGYNVQKALDGEMRARMDNLALSTYPMLAMDANAVPRDGDFRVRPGRVLLTNGDPNAVLREFRFSEPGRSSFTETANLERMIQMGTGSMDSASPIGISPRNQTASGMSMISSGAMKRMKRTLQNIERDFLNPLLQKMASRYMQFDTERYPFNDYIFRVKSGLGIVARELEQANLVQLLQTSQPGSPAYFMVLRNIWDLSAVESRDEMIKMTEQLLEQSLQPPPPPPELELKKAELELKGKEFAFENQKFMWERAMDIATYRNEQRKINQRSTEYAIDMQKVEMERKEGDASALDKTASAIERLAKIQNEETVKSISTLISQAEKIEEMLENVHAEGESARTEARTEFMDIVKDLEGRAAALEAREPAVQIIEGEQGPPGKDGAASNEMLQAFMDMSSQIEELKKQYNIQSEKKEAPAKKEKLKFRRDENGRVIDINGRPVIRNQDGMIEEVEI